MNFVSRHAGDKKVLNSDHDCVLPLREAWAESWLVMEKY